MLKLQTAEELYESLSEFRVLTEASGETVIPLSNFTDEAFLEAFIDDIKSDLKTGEPHVAASQLVKRLGYLLAVPALYAATTRRQRMEVTDGSLVLRENDGKWMPHLLLERAELTPIGGEGFRAFSWELFTAVGTVVRAVSKAGKVPRPVLWENVAIYVYWLYEKRLSEEQADSAETDFAWLTRGMPGDAFGERRNPLGQFFNDKPGDGVRTRTTCCFYYEGAGCGSYCGTCPKKKR